MKAHKAVNRKPKAKVVSLLKTNTRLAAKKPELNKFVK